MLAGFLSELRHLQPSPLPRTLVPERADLVTLYSRFLATELFRVWWEDRRAQAVAAALLADGTHDTHDSINAVAGRRLVVPADGQTETGAVCAEVQ